MSAVATVELSRWRRMTLRLAEAPRWILIVAGVVALGGISTIWAGVDVARRGFADPLVFGGGAIATFAISYVYVTVVQKGEVLEAIDLSEVPVIALALVLPPGEAVLAVAAGSVLSQIGPRRSVVKKAFNVGIRCLGTGCVALAASVVGDGTFGVRSVAAVLGGTVLYTVVGLVAVAAVVSAVQGEPLSANLTRAWRPRAVAWVAAAVIGVTAAAMTPHRPAELLGLAAALALVRYATVELQREQTERHRLQCLIEATAEVLDATDKAAQEAAVLEAGRKLLLWRDVMLRDEPPAGDEAGVALWRSGNRSGWLVARSRPGGDPWRDEDRRILEALSAAANNAFERAEMQQELKTRASLDPLTGLANRREFDAQLDAALNGVGPVGVILLDLDGFKPVNDSLGHDAGDELLRVVARRLTETVRSTDLVARIGGDEFVVLLRGANRAATERVARDLRVAISEPAEVGQWRLSVTASAGAAVAPDDGRTRPMLLRAADQRMYAEKPGRDHGAFLAVATNPDRVFSS